MEDFFLKGSSGNIEKEGRKIVVFDVPSDGQFQFILPVLNRMIEKKTEYLYFLAHRDSKSKIVFDKSYPLLRKYIIHTNLDEIKRGEIKGIDIYITSEQYTLGLIDVFSVCIFHGQPSKGLTFTKEIIGSFDAFFLYGQLQLEAYNDYVREYFQTPPKHIRVFKIGYPKTDILFSSSKLFPEIPRELGLVHDKKTILYAPAFNKHASLQENGIAIINKLCEGKKYNVIVKLPIDCFSYKDMPYEFDNVNWLEELRAIKDAKKNLFLYDKMDIYPVMVHSDLMITCVSSVGLEFMLLKKPVMFVETPNFYDKYLKKRLPLERNIDSYKEKAYVNGGKKFGVSIRNINSLIEEIEETLSNHQAINNRIDSVEDYLLYNPGNATETAVNKIIELLDNNSVSNRKYEYGDYTYDFVELLNLETDIDVGLIGAGKYGQDIYSLLKKSNNKVNIRCYLDNDPQKWNNEISSIIISPISRNRIMSLDKVIITSTYWKEIVEQLTEMNIPLSKIVLVTRY